MLCVLLVSLGLQARNSPYQKQLRKTADDLPIIQLDASGKRLKYERTDGATASVQGGGADED